MKFMNEFFFGWMTAGAVGSIVCLIIGKIFGMDYLVITGGISVLLANVGLLGYSVTDYILYIDKKSRGQN